jgi:uncharacterized protein
LKIFTKQLDVAVSQELLFNWHESPGAFSRLTPYWEKVTMQSQVGGIRDGDEVKVKVNILGPVSLSWHLKHEDYIYGQQFVDKQNPSGFRGGMFDYWKHSHIMSKSGDNTSQLKDNIEYRLPLSFIGNLFGSSFVEAKLNRLFDFRHRVTKVESKIFQEKKQDMKILVVGSRGLVGTDLVSFLKHQGHEVVRLSRSKKASDTEEVITWDPDSGCVNEADFEGFDAVINLAGENIASKRWTPAQKEEIKQSRVDSTSLIANALAKVKNPPRVFVCASATGFYGDRPDEVLNENSVAVKGDFLSETCVAWEAACKPAADVGIRVVNARFGIILSPKGGAMAKLLLPFQLGLGGQIGNGEQVMSWIALDDVVYALNYVAQNETISGPVNFTSPNPVTNLEFTKALGKVLQRPTIFPVPSFGAKLVFGEMADALLLSSQKVKPTKLESSGYEFAYADLELAFRHLLGK